MFKNLRNKLTIKDSLSETELSLDEILLIDGNFMKVSIDEENPVHLTTDQAQEIVDKLNSWIERRNQK